MSLLASLLSSQATGIGALPILFGNSIKRLQWALMGFGGGVMLAATVFSLIIPGIKVAVRISYSVTVAASIIVIGNLLGWCFLWLIERHFSHEHFFKKTEESIRPNLQRIWLFILAITLHNLPEGLVVGVGFGSEELANDAALATAIGLQNLPEGLVVALSLKTLNYSTPYAIGVSFITGLVEPIGSFLGAELVSQVKPLLPWSMAFAAGAMLFVLINEILPETYRKSVGKEGSVGVLLGFMVMMFLDIALG